jgi:hypoxanthine phosphoribosyltransferase
MASNAIMTSEQIKAKVKMLAGRISEDYVGQNIVVLGVLKGSFMFMADLIRQCRVAMDIEFVTCSSYKGTETTGKVLLSPAPTFVWSKHVLIVEDIVDTGLTLQTLITKLNDYHPASIEVCALLNKPSRRKVEVPVKYVGMNIPNEFVVGYGMDYQGMYRNFNGVYILNNEGKRRFKDVRTQANQ